MCVRRPGLRCSGHQFDRFYTQIKRLIDSSPSSPKHAAAYRSAHKEGTEWLRTPKGIEYLKEKGQHELARELEQAREVRRKRALEIEDIVAGLPESQGRKLREQAADALDAAGPKIPGSLVDSLIREQTARERDNRSRTAEQEQRRAAAERARIERAKRDTPSARRRAALERATDPANVLRALAGATESVREIREDARGLVDSAKGSIRTTLKKRK